MTLHVFCYREGQDLWVAESLEDVARVYRDETGVEVSAADFDQYDDNQVQTIHEGETHDTPSETKLCGQWAASNGAGYLSGGES